MQCTTGSDGVAQAVRSHYEALGELYRAAWGDSVHFAVFHADEDRSQAVTAMERMLADEAGMRQGDSVLDVGCGTGGPAIAVAAHSGVHVTGIDLVPGHVERARVRAAEHRFEDRTEFVEGDATEMPFPDASFDHVYAIESAYHAADKPRFYAECARVLRPGGSFVGTDWLRGAASNGDHAAVLERLCEQFAIPSLIDLTTLRRHLVAAGLVPDVVEDLSNLGNVERNWDALELTIWPRLARAARNARRTPRRTPCRRSPTAPRRSPRPRPRERSSWATGGQDGPHRRVLSHRIGASVAPDSDASSPDR